MIYCHCLHALNILSYTLQCPIGLIGNGRECSADPDLDGIPNTLLTIGCDHPPCIVVSLKVTSILGQGARKFLRNG